MAEIRVEPRKKAPIWPWIVGLLIVLGLIWVLIETFYKNDEYNDDLDDTKDAIEDSNQVGIFNLPEDSVLVSSYTMLSKKA